MVLQVYCAEKTAAHVFTPFINRVRYLITSLGLGLYKPLPDNRYTESSRSAETQHPEQQSKGKNCLASVLLGQTE
ncbi:MAG: hypothetical protein COA89_05620 [Acidithiobacillus sp.]|nr:MAG: hypothetical protein COA89_05620 [Acidithiobacillus sp.]RTZ66111.1 MAG: hypothetical protein DSZ34_01885 [Gammaproteobacteria bacterium]